MLIYSFFKGEFKMENKNKGKECSHSHNHSHEHNHSHGHSHMHNHSSSSKNIKIAFLLNFTFSIIEIFGGILTNSSAILSDAIHDLGDSLSLGLAMVFEKKSEKNANKVFTYGYKRLSVISAIINILVLAIGTVLVLRESIERLLSPQPIVAEGMLFLAIIGVLINGISVFRMKSSIKISEKAVMLHLLEDLFGWIAVFIVSIVVMFTDFYILDPILSLIICFIMIRNIYYGIKSLYKIIMQAIPEGIEISKIENEIFDKIDGISIESFRVWSLDGESNVASLNILTNDISSVKNIFSIKDEVKHILSNHNIEDVTVEISSR